MSGISISISSNADALLEALKNTPEYIDSIVKKAVTDACIIVEARAKENCRVDTGRLRASITHEVSQGKHDWGFSGRVGTNVEYAPYVEFGTGWRGGPYSEDSAPFKGRKKVRGMLAHAFLYPALASNFKRISDMVADAVKEAHERLASRSK